MTVLQKELPLHDFVAQYVANQQLGGNALLSALGDVGIANVRQVGISYNTTTMEITSGAILLLTLLRFLT